METAHFLHIGKTGGTAIKSALNAYLYAGRYHIRCHAHHVTLRDISVGDKVFFVLRDPVKRFVSGFLSRKRCGRPRHNYPWSPHEAEAFRRFQTPGELARALRSNTGEERSKAVEAMSRIGHVRTSYWNWFESEPYFLSRLDDILMIGFLERLDEDFQLLKGLLGLPDFVELPTDEVLAHKNPTYNLGDFGTFEAEVIRSWYQTDYDFIEICKSSFIKG